MQHRQQRPSGHLLRGSRVLLPGRATGRPVHADHPRRGQERAAGSSGGSAGGVPLQAITDGTSNTFLAGEQIQVVTQWNAWVEANQSIGSTAVPLNYLAPGVKINSSGSVNVSNGASDRGNWFHWYSFRSMHPGGGNFAMCDGSVKFIKSTINMATYQGLSTRAQGEIISADQY